MAREHKSGKEAKGKNDIKSKKQESPKKNDQGHHFLCVPKTGWGDVQSIPTFSSQF
ncbi:hypothetical protein PIB30_051291 [Stylosanthes scabra]|uniref:Uncharacterized protein n=1 Tax=Stylosanthes scabra TaxID=79078 RepID=A0ABU6XJA0_9FABA|nr:hypothetical protein [Stylosanthes scabra]